MRDFRKLLVWEKGHELVLKIYRLTRSFPIEEQYGLTGQLRRAASSIPTNIAEGCGRDSNGDFRRFLQIAAGSASEVEYHLQLSCDLGYLSKEDYAQLDKQINDIKKMLTSLIKKLTTKS